MTVGSDTDPCGTICSKGNGGWSLNYIPGVIYADGERTRME